MDTNTVTPMTLEQHIEWLNQLHEKFLGQPQHFGKLAEIQNLSRVAREMGQSDDQSWQETWMGHFEARHQFYISEGWLSE